MSFAPPPLRPSDEQVKAALAVFNRYEPREIEMAMEAALSTFADSLRGQRVAAAMPHPTLSDAALRAARAFGAGLDPLALEQPSEVL